MKYTRKQNQKTRVILYTRVSTDEQAENGFSLDNQIDLLRRECTKKGYEIVEHFQDDGYSATSFKRPAFQKLLTFIKKNKGKAQKILVTKWCRFSRNSEQTLLMIHELHKHGITVATLDDVEESDDPSAILFKMIAIALPEVANRIRSRNTKEGIRKALTEGYYPYGMPPIGYSKDHGGSKTPLLVPNEKAELVVEAFELFSTGLYQLEELRKKLWKKGLKLGDTQFGQMLRNPIYMGKIVVPEYKDEEACLVNGLHQALVSESLFLKVQRVLENRRTKNSHVVGKSKLREELPLRGYLRCYKCGRIWTGSVSKGNGGKYAYYHCHNECGERASAEKGTRKI